MNLFRIYPRAFFFVIFFSALLTSTQILAETIELKSGRILVGTIEQTDHNDKGILMRVAGNEMTVVIKWDQMVLRDRERLQGKSSSSEGKNLIDGIQVITKTDIWKGVLISENKDHMMMKTKDGMIQVDITDIMKRTHIKMNRHSIYTPLEILQAKEGTLPSQNPDSFIILGHLARDLHLYDEARQYFNKALTMDQNKEVMVSGLLDQLKEEEYAYQASTLFLEIQSLSADGDIDKALDIAKILLEKYSDSREAKQHANLIETLTLEKTQKDKDKLTYLAPRIAQKWYSLIKSLIAKQVSKSIDDAGKYVADEMDHDIIRILAKTYNISEVDVTESWKKRSKKKISATYGSGSWILSDDAQVGFDYNGNIPQKAKRRLQTETEWWKSSSSSTKKSWLLAYYTVTTKYLEKQTDHKKIKCKTCRSKGVIQAQRGDQRVDVVCPRCHGSKYDISIIAE